MMYCFNVTSFSKTTSISEIKQICQEFVEFQKSGILNKETILYCKIEELTNAAIEKNSYVALSLTAPKLAMQIANYCFCLLFDIENS